MQASVIVLHRLSCSSECGIFRGQGLNLCLLYWQVDSYPQGFIESSVGKEAVYNAGDPGSIHGLGRSAGEGIG